LPRKTRTRVVDFFWYVAGIILQVAGVLVFLWGLTLFFRHHLATDADGNDAAKKATFLIIGLGIFALGYSIRKIRYYGKGQIDSVFLKNAKKNKE